MRLDGTPATLRIAPRAVQRRVEARARRGGTPEWESRIIRGFDIALSLIALVILLPVLVAIVTLVFATDPGPVLFAHRRLGAGGRAFACLKFRTMVMDAEARLAHILATDDTARAEWARDHKLKRDPRITPLGRFLRSSSLDELPQLINVLRGEMSLVGPRPIVEGEVVRYGRYFKQYCRVRPGITGLWQVSGRNDVSYRRRVALDVAYARSYSLRLNTRIMLMTIPSVLFARGSY